MQNVVKKLEKNWTITFSLLSAKQSIYTMYLKMPTPLRANAFALLARAHPRCRKSELLFKFVRASIAVGLWRFSRFLSFFLIFFTNNFNLIAHLLLTLFEAF